MAPRRRPPRAPQLGVTDADYARLLAAQDGHCALCPNTPKTRRLHVDHDHRTGAVRGLLCFSCNRTLPHYKDAAWMLRAARYLGATWEQFRDESPPPRPPRPASTNGPAARVVDARVLEMRELRMTGATYATIAERYGITRQRVHQLIGGAP